MPQIRLYAVNPNSQTQITSMRVDRANATIYGVTAMMANVEATGHGIATDNKTIQMMLALSQDGRSRRQRFGHPGISENYTGKQVSNAVNFRIENGNLVHDAVFLPEARKSPAFAKDPVDYILSLAENNPTEFGESVVITCDAVWILQDGSEVSIYDGEGEDDGGEFSLMGKPSTAVNDIPMIRPVEFHYVDWVNEGAATHNGMFGKQERFFTTGASAWAEELFDFVDTFRETYNIPLNKIPTKTKQLLDAYMFERGKGETLMKRGKILAKLSEEPVTQAPAAPPVESLEDQTQEEINEQVDADLDAVAQRAESLAQRVHGAQPVALDVLEVTIEPFIEQLAQRIESLEATIESINADYQDKLDKLQSRFDRVYDTQVNLLATLEALEINQRKLAGEPVVVERVQATKPLTLESHFLFQSPRPPVLKVLPKPVGMEQAKNGLPENASPLERSIALQQERAKFANFSTP